MVQGLMESSSIEFKKTSADEFYVSLSGGPLDVEDCKFCFALFKDREKVEEVRWISENWCKLKWHGDGVYFVQIEVKSRLGDRLLLRTNAYEFFTKKYIESIERDLLSCCEYDIGIDFAPSRYPFCDFVVVSGKGLCLDDMEDRGGFKSYSFHYSDTEVKIIFNGCAMQIDGVTHLFSGFALPDAGGRREYVYGIQDYAKFISGGGG